MRSCLLLLFAVVAAAWATPARAEVTHVPLQEPTIMSAMFAAQRGDTIRVAPGVYRENVMLRSGVTLMSDVGPLRTTLVGSEGRPVVHVPVGGRGTLLDGFTLDGGAEGVRLDGSSLDVQECHVRFRMTTGFACGSRGELYLRSCVVERCETGVLVDAGGRLTLLNCSVSGNETGVQVNSIFGRVLRSQVLSNGVGIQIGPRGAAEVGGTRKFGNDFLGNGTAVWSLADTVLHMSYNSWGVTTCDSIRVQLKGNVEFLPAMFPDRSSVLDSCN